MPNQILPVDGLDQVGLILDTPPIALPPAGFSDALNVRFRDGAVRKMEGEVNIFPNIFDPAYVAGLATNANEELKYVAWWPNPNLADNLQGYYLVIIENKIRNRDIAYLVLPAAASTDSDVRVEKGAFTPAPSNSWQHTFFQGGFALIINNGVDAPAYILDLDGNEEITTVPNFATLPGWESYNIRETVIEDVFTASSSRLFDLGRAVNFETHTVTVQDVSDTSHIDDLTVVLSQANIINGTDVQANRITAAPRSDDMLLVDSDSFQIFTTNNEPYTASAPITIGIGMVDDQVGRSYRITVSSRAAVSVTAGVVRSFGDFLVAGNLTEVDSEQPVFDSDGSVNMNRVLRNLPGVVRTSDVAEPGQIPVNWNPFAAGVSTADEFVISDTGIVQDMVELQGNLYLYSNTSIAVLRRTGNAAVPFTASSVTSAYGAQTTEAVTEFDGSHFVVGSQDIYLFGGHPGSIQSVADQRVRRYFFDDLNPLHEDNMFVLRYQQKDEVWICYPSTASIAGEIDKALIWNYRLNNWTIRELRNVVSGDVAPIPGGGIPGARVILTGLSGDNGIDALGTNEKQTIVIDSEFSTPDPVIAGRPHITEINIDNLNQTFPGFFARGPLFWDFTIGPNFNSGQGSDQITPLAFRFALLEADNTFADGFPFDVVLDSDTRTANSIMQQLEADSEFFRYFEIYDTDDSDEFVIQTKALPNVLISDPAGRFDNFLYPEYTTGSITIDGVILADSGTRDTLTRDSECDIQAPDNGQLTNVGVNSTYQFSAFVEPDCVGQLYFIDVLNSTNVDSDNLRLQVDSMPPAGENVLMYGVAIRTDEDMYEEGRGGQTERPNRFPGSADSELNSQDFYQDALPATQSVTLPWRPTVSGAHSFQVNVPSANGSTLPIYVGENIRLTAYEVPPPAASNADHTQILRTSNPVGMGSNIISAPSVTFETGYYVYDSDVTHSWMRMRDSDVIVPIYGDFNVGQVAREDEVALYIRDGFNRQAGDIWTARDEERGQLGHVNLTSDVNRWQYVDVVDVESPLLLSDFTAVDSEYGREAISPTLGNVHPPRFKVTGPGFVDSEFLQLNGDSEYSPGEIIGQLLVKITERDNQRWSGAASPARTDSDRFIVLENDENTPIEGVWQIELASVGNMYLTADSEDPGIGIGLTLFHPTFLNSRAVRGAQNTGSFDVGGITVTIGDGDSRGADFTRATPTLMAIRVRNTSVPTGQEVIILSAYDGATYNPVSNPSGVNTARLTAPEVLGGAAVAGGDNHPGWVSTLRLANRRLNIQYAAGSSEFRIVPVNYDDLASFALQIEFNNTEAGAAAIQSLFDETQAGTLDLNPYGLQQLPQGTGNPTLGVATNAYPVGDIPLERNIQQATLQNVGPTPGVRFDVDRPWDTININPNKEFPIFASSVEVDNVLTGQATASVQLNKIVAADVGWSYPLFSIDETRNDDSEAYESYVERTQLALRPEFDTEHVASVAILADGEYSPSIDSDPLRNRLELRMSGTGYPGETASLALADSETYISNAFNISEDYKVDMRVHGRLLNARITDNVQEANPNPAKFNNRTEWNVSGLQIEFSKDGRR